MFTLSSIRQKARLSLRRNPTSFKIVLLPVLLTLLINLFTNSQTDMERVADISQDTQASIYYLLSILGFTSFYRLLLALLLLSVSYSLFLLMLDKKGKLSDSLAIFSHPSFGKFLAVFSLKTILLILWGLIFYIGAFLLLGSSILIGNLSAELLQANSVEVQESLTGMIAIGFLVFIAGLFLVCIGLAIYLPQVYAYSQAENILFQLLEADTYTSARAILKESRQLMKGYKWKRFLLDLSFLGWFILTIITGGLADFYVLPYHKTAQIYFYQAILEEKRTKSI
ncbi:DUF975 family protein [Streptococcus suis]|uniref:DUF975 family protein n=1 Tax=Streptococcus suis TaxID=1307 RepID=UPI00147830B1